MNRLKGIADENITIEEMMKIVEENQDEEKNMHSDVKNESDINNKRNYNYDIDSATYEPKNISSILVLNKIDLVENKRKLKALQEELEDLGAFDKVFHISCETNFGIESLKKYLEGQAIRRPWRFHPDVSSCQTEVEKAEEILKQILYDRFYKEIPYNIIGYVTSWVPMSNGQIKINFNIEVKYDVHISIVIGKESRIIKEIREELDKLLAMQFQMPIKTNLFLTLRKKGQLESLNEKGILNI